MHNDLGIQNLCAILRILFYKKKIFQELGREIQRMLFANTKESLKMLFPFSSIEIDFYFPKLFISSFHAMNSFQHTDLHGFKI